MANLSEPDPEPSSPDPSEPGRVERLRRALRRITAIQPRTHWWNLIDYFEARPLLIRRLVIGGVAAAIIGLGGGFAYVRWHRLNSIRVARQWLAAGRLDRAAPAIQLALTELPLRPESWALAADLAWRSGQKKSSVQYAEHAAAVSRDASEYVLAWASAAVLADDADDADRALQHLDPRFYDNSAAAQRIGGEVARQRSQYAAARDRFAAALKLDLAAPGAPTDRHIALDEVPLGMMALRIGTAADHRMALDLLTRWAADPRWGADALRDLLADAIQRRDRAAMIRWAEALRDHPRCLTSDLPACLLALSSVDQTRFQAMLGPLESEYGQQPVRIAVLMGYLTQIGRPQEGLRWARSLPTAITENPPAAVAIAEALRKEARWAELSAWVNRNPWSPETEFLRSAYRLAAAHALGDKAAAALATKTLDSQVQNQSAFAMFAGANLYVWGLTDEAIPLLWIASEHPNVAFEALGMLVRHYQVQHDAIGEYKVFRRLYALRPKDPAIAHNFAFFAILTGQYDFTQIERIAKDNFQKEPHNPLYRANYAFLLDSTGRTAEGMALLEASADQWKQSQGFAFAYGLALAQNGRKEEAKTVLASVNLRPLSKLEQERIQAALK